MNECLTNIRGHQYHLEFGPTLFDIHRDQNLKGRPCIIFSWLQKSQFKNIVYLRLLIFHLGWPWITYTAAVTDYEDESDES
ncbi:hypothetical protein ES703_59830 [subsurface metagenome]